ncbi:hypothetical protein B7463_g6701, partial [Scytalidium lignicola]
MLSDKVTVLIKALAFFIPYLARVAIRRMVAYGHSWTWRNTPDAQNVVVLGGSFAGIELVNRLVETLPTGYKAVWIEKNSHLNYSFNFPRFSVIAGHEHTAFIPYDGIAKGAPAGIVSHVQDTVVGLTGNQVLLASGDKVDYAYLAIATGSSQPLPVQVVSTERSDACRELQGVQQFIRESRKVAIVGGGAVGVELASDIKDFYPDKEVTLIHSRGQLLSNFGKRLQDYALTALRDELEVRVVLNERPKMLTAGNFAQSASLTFSDGREEQFDLVIGCTGQRPNSAFLAGLYPGTVAENSRILVRPTLQVFDADSPTKINGRTPWHHYTPNLFFEGAIKLTLGKTHHVIYAMQNDTSDIIIPSRNRKLDLGIESAWKLYGVDFKLASEGDTERGETAVTAS